YKKRLAAANLPAEKVLPLLAQPKISSRGLNRVDAAGKVVEGTRTDQIVAFTIPLILLMLMFIVVLVGTSPLTTNLIEEKQLRIAEVLLGSVSPFELMMGKLLGGVGVALTLAAIYFSGAYFVARQYHVQDMVSPGIIAWFLFFTIVSTIMYGSMFVAVGAAVTNVKEAQSMMMPVILVIMLPIFIMGNLLKDPHGILATIASFFPTSAPMVTTARLAIPPGIPTWQPIASALVALGTTVVLVWAAGRVFRVGILMQGQGANPAQLLKWIIRG
ncbi:MAG: ABC transporter permease, partial [Tepidisphaeraceae bacterium]